ncbi:MAG: DUF3105 domain-containing protein, partial [Actinomycetota bacterium]|nr:DUF3105 domain-containing protein [Actinomycetota bacterium]
GAQRLGAPDVSSRKEEKERLRQERLAKEQAAAAAERRRRLLGMLGGGVLAAAALAAIVVAVIAGGGGSDGPKPGSGEGPKVRIPAQRITELDEAAKAAGCTVRSFAPGPNDRQHVDAVVNYPQNPPVFGPHNPTAATDGNYVGQGTVDREQLVHSMEHGRVIVWYRPDTPRRRVSQLETLFYEPITGRPPAYKQLLVGDDAIPGAVAATAWGQQMVCRTFTDKTFDALRTFRARNVDKGPENIPFQG